MTKLLNFFEFHAGMNYRIEVLSGVTVALAVVLAALAMSHGPEYVFAAVVMAGLLEIGAGLLRLGKVMRLVPHPVIFGFMNGLAIIIFTSQFEQFRSDSGAWLAGTELATFATLVLVAMTIIWQLPRFTRAVPASLVAILVVFALVMVFGIDTRTVGDITSMQGGLPPFHIPAVPISLDTLKIIFPYAAIVAAVGLIESLLTLNIIDEITETRGRSNKECIAQGSANVLSGLFSGMGGCAMLGQSLINISSGARACPASWRR